MLFRILISATACLLTLSAAAAEGQGPTFADGWSPEAPPGQTMAGFVTIRNPTEHEMVLVGGESPQFERVEIHTMTMDDGIMRMRRLDRLVVPAGETVVLKPRGLHLMLIAPRTGLAAGEHIQVSLRDNDGNRHDLELEIRQR